MGRTVIAEEKTERELGRLTGAQSVQIGLLIGQVTAQRDYVAFCVSTPSLKELGREGSAGASLFDDWWVVEHSREVSALLPGGLSVVGLFLVCPTDLLRALLPRLRKLLLETTSHQSSIARHSSSPHMERILLHTCLRTKKHKAQTVDLADPQAGFRPAELKFQPHCSRWHRLECSLALQFDSYSPSVPEPTLHKTIRSTLQPTLEAISNSLVTLRGRVCQADEPLVRPTNQRKSHASSSGETVQAAMFLRKPSSAPHGPQNISKPAHLCLNGSMRCFAYVYPRATCGEAVAAVREDAVRSLVNRVELACREPDQVETDESEHMDRSESPHKESSCTDLFALCQLPRRVMFTVPTAGLPLSGYCFPNDTEEEVKCNLGDLLGTQSTDIAIQQLENFPALPTEEEVAEDPTTENRGSLVPAVSLTVAITVGLVAFAMWFVQSVDVNI